MAFFFNCALHNLCGLRDSNQNTRSPQMENVQDLALGKLGAALSKAQAQIETPKKKQSVTFSGRSYKYADLAEVLDSIRKPLSDNSLALTSLVDLHESKGTILKTSLIHSSGESITSFYPLPDPSKVKAQDFGSALTYARRYSISCLIGIASEDDDDGENAPSPEPQKKNFAPAPQKPSHPEYFDDLDQALDRPKSKLQGLYDFVDQNAVPTDIVKGYIKQITGSVKSSSALTDFEIDCLLTKIKSNLK